MQGNRKIAVLRMRSVYLPREEQVNKNLSSILPCFLDFGKCIAVLRPSLFPRLVIESLQISNGAAPTGILYGKLA